MCLSNRCRSSWRMANTNHYIVSCPSGPLQFRSHSLHHCQQPARSWTHHWLAFPPGSQQRNFLQKKITHSFTEESSYFQGPFSSAKEIFTALRRLLQPFQGSYSPSEALTAPQKLLQPFKGSYSLDVSQLHMRSPEASLPLRPGTPIKDSSSKALPKLFCS